MKLNTDTLEKTDHLNQVKHLNEIIKKLNTRIAELERENLELWEIVDEITESVILNQKSVT